MKRIYLDQNVLSDLRDRKLKESNDSGLIKLKSFCKSNHHEVIYSFTHFDEISQIPKKSFQTEHINLLKELNATYLSPIYKKDEPINATAAWNRYLETEQDNESSGTNEACAIQQLILKKLSGLPILLSFHELDKALKEATHEMLSKNILDAKSIRSDEVTSSEYQALKGVINYMEIQIKELPNSPSLKFPNENQLGPKEFRKLEPFKENNFKLLPASEVILKIDNVFKQHNPDYNWKDFLSDSQSDQISRCYSLMNWVGYYADDFNKVKKHKDRFMASHNDLMHVTNATTSNYLITNDQALLKKADACYKYINLDIQVCEPNCAIHDL